MSGQASLRSVYILFGLGMDSVQDWAIYTRYILAVQIDNMSVYQGQKKAFPPLRHYVYLAFRGTRLLKPVSCLNTPKANDFISTLTHVRRQYSTSHSLTGDGTASCASVGLSGPMYNLRRLFWRRQPRNAAFHQICQRRVHAKRNGLKMNQTYGSEARPARLFSVAFIAFDL